MKASASSHPSTSPQRFFSHVDNRQGFPTLALALIIIYLPRRVTDEVEAVLTENEIALSTVSGAAHPATVVLPGNPTRRRRGRESSGATWLWLRVAALTEQIIDGGANFGIAYASECCQV